MYARRLAKPAEKVRAGPPLPRSTHVERASNSAWDRLATRVQPKLCVGAPGDEHEREADRIADKVMRVPASAPSPQYQQLRAVPQTGATIKAQPSAADAPAVIGQVLRSAGQPLGAATRAFFEPRFGHDFSAIRVHSDDRAVRSARGLNALAYTVGRNIAFGNGQYAPQARSGQRLLAHELAHVVQQRQGLFRQSAEPDGGTGPAAGPLESELEREAPSATEATAEESGGESEYADEPGLEGELPHPEDADTPDLMGPPVGEELQAKAKKGKRIVVNLDKQTATAMEDGKAVRTMPISSGKAGHRTTKGQFTINETDKDHKSSTYGKCVSKSGRRDVTKGAGSCKKGEKYEGAPMPFFQRFNGAEGLHQGKLPGHPDSHGCVRLSKDNAEWLWAWAGSGTKIDVGPSTTPGKK